MRFECKRLNQPYLSGINAESLQPSINIIQKQFSLADFSKSVTEAG